MPVTRIATTSRHPRRLFARIGFLAALLLGGLPGSASATGKVLDASVPPRLSFDGHAFGSIPTDAMTCRSGACPNPLPGAPQTLLPLASYTVDGGRENVAGIPVTPPRYMYWQQRLFRIVFRLECDEQHGAACLAKVIEQLDARYGLTLLNENTLVGHVRDSRTEERLYVTRSGALVETRLARWLGEWELPLVEIFDKGTLDAAARAANPDYRARRVWVPEAFVASEP